MLKQILHNQGLTSKEIGIYTCLLEFGEQPASIIARKVGLPRSGCYIILAKLCSRGLLVQIIKNRLTYYAASSPSNLLERIQQNHSREIKQIETLKLNLKINQKNQPGFGNNSRAHYFSGQSAIEKLIEQILFNSRESSSRVVLSANLFTPIKSADLLPVSAQNHRILTSQKLPHLNTKNIVKKLPTSFDLGLDVIINHRELACICLPENFAIHIESPLIASCMGKVFDFVWKISRQF